MVAKKLLEKREGEITQGKLPGIEFEKVKFDHLAEEFLRDYRINQKKTLGKAISSVNHLKNYFENMSIPNITTPQINKYIEMRMTSICMVCQHSFLKLSVCPNCGSDDVKKGAANATINRELSALKRMLNLGAWQTPPKVDRVPKISMLKENNVRKGFFEHYNFIALRDALPDYLKGFVTFAYKTGWRESELKMLTWSLVDQKNGIIRLEPGSTKNDEARTVYLDTELKDIIVQQWKIRKDSSKIIPYVFSNKDGNDRITDFRKAWNTACRKIGIGYGYNIHKKYAETWGGKLPKGPTIHDFRRTAVRNSVRSGIPERVAMMISGHKTRSVFDRYNIVNDADLKAAAIRQEEYLREQEKILHGHNLGTVCQIKRKNED